MHRLIKGGVRVTRKDHLVVTHESGAGGGFAASVGSCPSDNDSVHLVKAQDRIQVGFEESVELVLDDPILEHSFLGLKHMRVHCKAGLSLPKHAFFADDRKLAQHQAAI